MDGRKDLNEHSESTSAFPEIGRPVPVEGRADNAGVGLTNLRRVECGAQEERVTMASKSGLEDGKFHCEEVEKLIFDMVHVAPTEDSGAEGLEVLRMEVNRGRCAIGETGEYLVGIKE